MYYILNKTMTIVMKFACVMLRGPCTLTWKLRTGDCKITLEDKKKVGNVTYYISSESLSDAESE